MGGRWGFMAILSVAAVGCSFFVDPLELAPITRDADDFGMLDFAVDDLDPPDASEIDQAVMPPDFAVRDLTAPPDLRQLPDLSLVCGSSCASCGNTTCCAEICEHQMNCEQTCNACRCNFVCDQTPGTCSVNCKSGSNCKVRTEDVGQSSVTCTEGSNCELSCDGQSPCSVACSADSQCLVRCNGASSCVIQCVGTKKDCGNGVQVCNRNCP